MAEHAKEALNFQITLLIPYLLGALTCFFIVGIFILLGTLVFEIVTVIMVAVAANKGELYRYPLNIRFIQ